jgi:predicted metalloprotease
MVRRGLPIGIGGLLLLVVLSLLTGQDFLSLLGPNSAVVPEGPGGGAPPAATTPEEERRVALVSSVLDDAQATWGRLLPGQYEEARLVLFRDAVESACGFAQAASGPFYCPADRKVYLDLSFFDELHRRFGAPGDFAQAYVIAHEIGHHVQTVLGIESQVRRAQQSRPDQANQLSVRLELQADCLAGVWARTTEQIRLEQGDVALEPGDIEEGMTAAAAIGDDRIQRETRGRVHPESFTHGTSAQRVEWLRRGFDSGNVRACDTFGR